MTIRCSIVENALVDGRKVCRAMVRVSRAVTAKEFIDQTAQDSTTIKADALGMEEEIYRILEAC
jgi:hypothetical protein